MTPTTNHVNSWGGLVRIKGLKGWAILSHNEFLKLSQLIITVIASLLTLPAGLSRLHVLQARFSWCSELSWNMTCHAPCKGVLLYQLRKWVSICLLCVFLYIKALVQQKDIAILISIWIQLQQMFEVWSNTKCAEICAFFSSTCELSSYIRIRKNPLK